MAIDIITAVALAANIAVAASIVGLIVQIYLQRKETKFSTYEKLMSEFTNASLFLAEHQQIADFLYGSDPKKTIPEDQYERVRWASFYYLDALLGLFERVWVAGRQGYIPQMQWASWRNWLSDLARKDVFKELFENTKQSYDPSFVKEVETILQSGA